MRAIENMKLQMSESEQVARKEIQRLDEAADEFAPEQKDLVKQRKRGERELGDLKTQLRSYNSSLQRYREALEKEMRDLKVAEDNLDRVRQRKDKTRTVQDEQSTDIPFWGLLAGAVLAGVMNMNLDSDNVDNTEEMNNCEPVRFGKVSEYWSSICQAQRRLHETDDKIHETEAKLQWASEKQEVVGDVQATTRKALQRLELLRGMESITELRTQQLDLLGPVMKVMEEMAAALGQITGDDLLHKEGIKGLIWDMRKNWFTAEQLVDGSRDIGEDE